MSVQVAYGKRSDIESAIRNGYIPKDTIIITNDAVDSESFFYDINGNVRTIAERTRFETFMEAEQWAKTYPCRGLVFTVHNGSEWLPYIVQDDGKLSPFKGETTEISDIKRIDGGNSMRL